MNIYLCFVGMVEHLLTGDRILNEATFQLQHKVLDVIRAGVLQDLVDNFALQTFSLGFLGDLK